MLLIYIIQTYIYIVKPSIVVRKVAVLKSSNKDSILDSMTITDNLVLNETQDCIEEEIEVAEVENETQEYIEVEVPKQLQLI